MHQRLRSALLSGLLAFACSKPGANGPVVLAAGEVAISIDPATGAYDVARGGQLVFQHALADVLYDTPDGRRLTGFDACTTRGRAPDGAFTCVAQGLELALTLKPFDGKNAFTAQLKATNRSASTITVLRLAPLVADPAYGGALWLGAEPLRHRVLENGQFLILDQAAQLNIPVAASPGINEVLPVPLRGSSVANWNHIVTDLDGDHRSLVAGYLTFDHSIPTLGLAPMEEMDAAGRTAFSYAAESALIFHGKPLAPGQSIDSEVLYVEPLPDDPLAALERYADAVAEHKHLTAWPKRGPDHVVPNGWNSWSGGDSTGGYGHDIDEALIKANLDVYARELQPFGARYFQVDDGWQHAYGDWTWNTDRFPAGGAGLASHIADLGLLPGLWIAAFSTDAHSRVATEHPDWLQPKEDGALGLFGSDGTLDLTNPDVRQHVRDVFTDFRNQGWKWAKVDFSYFDVLGKPQFDPTWTNVESWSAGWQIIRDTLGPDVFLVGIGIMGTNIGRVDGMRLTNDDGPRWEDPKPDDATESSRSFKETVRVGSRRWFYQNRIWVNHNDLLYFRSDPDPAIPRLSLTEARTFASWVGLGGGIVKIGDRLLDLGQHPEQVDVVRRLLPAWPDGARPLDVMTRDFPEQYRQHVSAPAGEWDVAGLLNWGLNRDWSTAPPTPMPEETRSYEVTCDDCLAWEFWTEQFLGRVQGRLTVAVEPRDGKVIALRPYAHVPQFLGSNRHITQGANDMGALRWDAGASILTGTLVGAVGPASNPFEYHLAFHVPDGFHLSSAQVNGEDVATTQDGPILRVRFTLPSSAQGQSVPFRLSFQ